MFVVVTTEFVVVSMLPAMASDLKISLADAGWFVTWFALAAAVLGPPLTMLAGRRDQRHVLVTAAAVFAAGNLAIALAPHYSVVVAVRLLQGCALPAVASVAIVAAARLAGAGREGWAISLVNVGVVAATVLGVPAGAMVADRAGWPASFAGLALSGLVSAGLVAVWFPRMKTAKQPSMLTEASLLWRPAFLVHLLLSGVMFTAMFAGYTYIAALLGTVADLDGATIAWALMGFGLAGAFGNWVAGRMVDRDPLAATAWVASALLLAMAAIAPAGQGPSVVLVLVADLWGAAHMAAFVISQVRVMRAAREAPAFAGVVEHLGLQSGHRPRRDPRWPNRGPLRRWIRRLRRGRRSGGCAADRGCDEDEPISCSGPGLQSALTPVECHLRAISRRSRVNSACSAR